KGSAPVPISHAEPITLTCPACGASHTAEIWQIVAPDERPDLVEQIRNGALHTVTCPQCDQTHTLDAPLLIFRPTAAPPILFSPAQQTTSEQDQQHAAALIRHPAPAPGRGVERRLARAGTGNRAAPDVASGFGR
ncbi:MAG: CpXC domain-containing protein, partial [Roseiflexus sp.]|nr:CpXC domain-containing protein [Roseiflexus sp.]